MFSTGTNNFWISLIIKSIHVFARDWVYIYYLLKYLFFRDRCPLNYIWFRSNWQPMSSSHDNRVFCFYVLPGVTYFIDTVLLPASKQIEVLLWRFLIMSFRFEVRLKIFWRNRCSFTVASQYITAAVAENVLQSQAHLSFKYLVHWKHFKELTKSVLREFASLYGKKNSQMFHGIIKLLMVARIRSVSATQIWKSEGF